MMSNSSDRATDLSVDAELEQKNPHRRQRVAWMHKIATDENQLKQRVNLQMSNRGKTPGKRKLLIQ